MARVSKDLGAQLRELQDRAACEPELAQRLHDDLRSVLADEGIATDGLRVLGDEAESDVAGYMFSKWTCRCLLYCPFCGECVLEDCTEA